MFHHCVFHKKTKRKEKKVFAQMEIQNFGLVKEFSQFYSEERALWLKHCVNNKTDSSIIITKGNFVDL